MPIPADLRPGQVFAHDFRVIRPLADGGMGSVFVVEQLSTGKERALKVMHPKLVSDARSRERFVQEARVAARIDSDHVVEVLGAGVDEDTGAPWLAMELLRGETLDAVMTRRTVLGPAEVAEVFTQLGHALETAHRAGIVHRDIKPENLYLAAPRRPGVPFTLKVLDFGIAKFIGTSMASAHTTSAVGSPLWMAPEQTSSGAILPAADVWALGLLAFHLLTGSYYWIAANTPGVAVAGLIAEILLEPLETASVRVQRVGAHAGLPAGFDAWFARCVVRDPAHRYADAGEAVRALLPLLGRGGQVEIGMARTVAQPSVPPTSGTSFGTDRTMMAPRSMPPQGGFVSLPPTASHPAAWYAGPPVAATPRSLSTGDRERRRPVPRWIVLGAVVGLFVVIARSRASRDRDGESGRTSRERTSEVSHFAVVPPPMVPPMGLVPAVPRQDAAAAGDPTPLPPTTAVSHTDPRAVRRAPVPGLAPSLEHTRTVAPGSAPSLAHAAEAPTPATPPTAPGGVHTLTPAEANFGPSAAQRAEWQGILQREIQSCWTAAQHQHPGHSTERFEMWISFGQAGRVYDVRVEHVVDRDLSLCMQAGIRRAEYSTFAGGYVMHLALGLTPD